MTSDEKENKTHMDGFGVTLAITALKAIALMCDIITFPIYVVIQRPWKKRALSKRCKAVLVEIESSPAAPETKINLNGIINNDKFRTLPDPHSPAMLPVKAAPVTVDATSITYRCVDSPGEHHIQLVRNHTDTMEKMFKYFSKVYSNKRCLGTREIFNEEDEVQPNGRVFKKYNMGDYKWKTFAEVEQEATYFGQGLRELGAKPKKNIVIFAETRAEWMIAAQGLFKQNIPLVTIYATLGEEAIAHGINETEVSVIITSHELLPKFKTILKKTPLVKHIIYMEDQLSFTDTSGFKEGVNIIPYREVVKKGSVFKIDATPPEPSDTAIIMYTSGSTGTPKGVIITHYNLIATVKGFIDRVVVQRDDVLLGFLPLAHVFELLAEHVCLLSGVPIGYSSALTMIDTSSKIKRGTKGDASVLQPTCMTAVPLILDRVSKGIREKVSKGSFISKVLFKFAYDYKAKWLKRGYDTPLMNAVVFSKVKALLGSHVRMMLSGGAPLSPETHEQMQICLCVQVIQGYGLTETTSCATVMDANDMVLGRVGAPTTMTDIRLVDWEEGNYRIIDKPYPRGEILIGGDHITAGYYKLPSKTEEEFFEENGKRWFRTGDIGEVHPDGCLKIIDRKKDLVKLQAGEYVSLGKVESELKTCPVVENICVYGDSTKDYTVALIVPNPQQLTQLAVKQGVGNLPFEDLCTSPVMEKAVIKELSEYGKKCKLAKFEVPAAIKLCSEVWTPDMGLVTAAFKLKRKDIQERYQHELNRMYAS